MTNILKIKTPKRVDYSTHSFHQYTVKLQDINRDKLCEHLQNKNIPFGVYYPVQLYIQIPYFDVRFKKEEFLNTNKLCKTVLSLPMHTELTKDHLAFISNTIIDFINE